MEYPMLKSPAETRQTLDKFRGYVHAQRTPEGAFYHMENMTSDHYPVLSSRKRRGVYLRGANPQGLIGKDRLCYADDGDFYIAGEKVEGLSLCVSCDGCSRKDICAGFVSGKTRCQKQMVSMGGYVLIFPDKKWVQTVKTGETYSFGDMEHVWTSEGKGVTLTLCKADGTSYGAISQTKPASPAEGALWMENDYSTPHLYQYSQGSWVAVENTYVRISSPQIGAGFSQYDGITIEGLASENLDGAATVWIVTDGSIVVSGLIAQNTTLTADVTVTRSVPEMDYVTVCANRLWGCRYGKNKQGDFVNEIYCSMLGNFKNFQSFMGISTDSAILSLGSDGPFTGAITYLDHPLFFKENMLHKIYVSDTGGHSVSHTPCRGVGMGSGKSLAIVGEVLYYKTRSGVCAYDGSLPVEVSQDLGSEAAGAGVAGVYGSKYYLGLENHLFVYDTAKGMWHREDSLQAEAFCDCGDELYAIAEDKIIGLLGAGGDPEEKVHWAAETGFFGLSDPESKYLDRLSLRMALERGATVSVSVRYDFSPEFEHIATVTGKELGSFTLPILPKRCDVLRLRLEGQGDMKLFSLTKTMGQGSDIP